MQYHLQPPPLPAEADNDREAPTTTTRTATTPTRPAAAAASASSLMYRIQRAQDPLPEVIEPKIYEGISNPIIRVIPSSGYTGKLSSSSLYRQVFLRRRENPKYAYQIFPPTVFQPIELSHGGPVWGHVLLGLVLTRRESDGMYEEPSSNADTDTTTTTTTSSSQQQQQQQLTKVAIKRIKLRILQTELANGCREDPYREIYRLQTIGDNQHVLPIVEALRDEKYLYIITPWCENGSLLDYIMLMSSKKKPICDRKNKVSLSIGEDRARKYFIHMMEDIQYIHEKHGICHRDIKPG